MTYELVQRPDSDVWESPGEMPVNYEDGDEGYCKRCDVFGTVGEPCFMCGETVRFGA